MLKKLAAWKAFILLNIKSCITPEQLDICEACIELFNLKYSGWISSIELIKHNMDLRDALDRKRESVNPKPEIIL